MSPADNQSTPSSNNDSIQRAQNWLRQFNEKVESKYGGTLTGSKDRASFWRMMLRGMDTVKDDEDPVTVLVALVGIAEATRWKSRHAASCSVSENDAKCWTDDWHQYSFSNAKRSRQCK